MNRSVCCAIFLLACSTGLSQEFNEHTADGMPWTLREFYTFPNRGAELDYAVNNGEWRIRQGDTALVEGMRLSITLGDGTVITPGDLLRGKGERKDIEDDLGKGKTYATTFPAVHDLEIRHEITFYERYPFPVFHLSVKNVGQGTVPIRKLVVAGTTEYARLSSQPSFSGLAARGPKVSTLRMVTYGGHVLCEQDGAPTLWFFEGTGSESINFAMGLLTNTAADAALEFQTLGGAWEGEARSTYDPPKKLSPGESLKATPLAVLYGAYTPEEFATYYAYALRCTAQTKPVLSEMYAYATLEEGSWNDIQKLAAAWKNEGVRYVLIPSNWESRSGSRQGGVGYPRNMSEAAAALRKTGTSVGLWVNPLAVMGGKAEFTAKTADGRTFVNPSVAAGRKYAEEQLQPLVAAGFSFFVVPRHPLPKEILSAFNLTQEEACTLALAAAASTGIPAYPEAGNISSLQALNLPAVRDTLKAIHVQQIPVAPLRLTEKALNEAGNVDAEVLTFAPLEIVGEPTPAIGHLLKALSKGGNP